MQAEQQAREKFHLDLNDTTSYSPLQTTPGNASRTAIYMKSVHSLPLPAALWDNFQRACSKGASNHQLAEIIKDDPVLAATILRSVNSAGFGLRAPITDVGRAISHLGHTLVRSIVARHAFSSSTRIRGKVYDIPSLWKHGMAVSALAEIIAAHIPGCNADEAGSIGLFHDIGKICFNLITEYMQPAEYDPDKGFLVFEYQRFACTHIEMGCMLARHWQLPEKIIEGISLHHHPAHTAAEALPDSIRKEILAVYLADMLSIHLGLAACNAGITPPHESYADLMADITLQEIATSQAIQHEVVRIQGIEF